MQLPRVLTIAITIVVTMAWAANVVVGFLSPERHDPTISAVFAVVVGAVYALRSGESGLAKSLRRKIAEVIDREDEPPPKDQRGQPE